LVTLLKLSRVLLYLESDVTQAGNLIIYGPATIEYHGNIVVWDLGKRSSRIIIILDIQGLQSDRPLSTLGLNLANASSFKFPYTDIIVICENPNANPK
jgi:hypothetical protein